MTDEGGDGRGSAAGPGGKQDDPTIVRLEVRADDLDTNGHVRGGVYLAFADHARWVLLGRAGIDPGALAGRGLGPVNLETVVRFHAEVRAGAHLEVATTVDWDVGGSGKVSRVHQTLHRGDGVLAAEVTSVSGLLDLTTRHLVRHPSRYWRELAARPELLGVAHGGPCG